MTTFNNKTLVGGILRPNNIYPNFDAGARLRVSQLTTQGDYKQLHDKAPLYFDEETNGTATSTYSAAESGVVMSVAADGDFVVRQTFQRHNYFAGKSHLVECTFTDFGKQAGVTKRLGYYSASTTTPFAADIDGISLYNDGSDVYFCIHRNGVEKLMVKQENWNTDTLNARRDSSGVTMDWDKFNIFICDFLYLGGTAVRLGFIINGGIYWCHVFVHANNFDTPIFKSPNQPIRYEIRSTGGAGEFNHVCAQVSSEGSFSEVGIPTAIDMRHTTITAATAGTYYALVGARLKAAYLDVLIDLAEVLVLGLSANDYYHWELRINPTVAGTFTYSDITNSALQQAIATDATNTVTDGKVIASGKAASQAAANQTKKSSLRIGSAIDGTADTLVLCITPIAGNSNVVCSGGLILEEFL